MVKSLYIYMVKSTTVKPGWSNHGSMDRRAGASGGRRHLVERHAEAVHVPRARRPAAAQPLRRGPRRRADAHAARAALEWEGGKSGGKKEQVGKGKKEGRGGRGQGTAWMEEKEREETGS